MHKTHGRVVQVVEESYDNRIRIYSRPRETRSHSPSCRPELQEPVREQNKYCSEQHWSPVTNKNKTFFLFYQGFVVKCWFTNTYNDALGSRTQFLDREGDSALPRILWHGPEVAFKLTFFRKIKSYGKQFSCWNPRSVFCSVTVFLHKIVSLCCISSFSKQLTLPTSWKSCKDRSFKRLSGV